VTQLRNKVLEELKLRNYSQATADAYVASTRRFAEHFHHSPEQLGPEHIRQYQLHFIDERKLEPKSIMVQMAALRFLYLKVLRRSYSRDDLPLPRTPRRQIPIVLSTDEVRRLIDAGPNLRYRTILITLYDTGMRRAELSQLCPEHIDKERMIIRIPHVPEQSLQSIVKLPSEDHTEYLLGEEESGTRGPHQGPHPGVTKRLSFDGSLSWLAEPRSFARFLAHAAPPSLGGRCPQAVRRTLACVALSGALHPSRRHLQSPLDPSGRPQGHLPLEGLRARRQEAQDDAVTRWAL
jgi:integrase